MTIRWLGFLPGAVFQGPSANVIGNFVESPQFNDSLDEHAFQHVRNLTKRGLTVSGLPGLGSRSDNSPEHFP